MTGNTQTELRRRKDEIKRRVRRERRSSRLSEGTATPCFDYQLVYADKEPEAAILTSPRCIAEKRLSVIVKEESAWHNRLYCGENLGLLRTLCDDFQVRGKVTLVYIDPPFATGALFETRDAERAY